MTDHPGPWSLALRQIDWQVFGTLTFAGRVPGESVFKRRLFDWLRGITAACVKCGSRRDFFMFARPEVGEKNGRPHCHVMLALLPCQVVREYFVAPWLLVRGLPSPATRLAHECGFGFCKFRDMESEGDAGLAYLSYDGADAYEFHKSAWSQQPILSRSLRGFLLARVQGQGLQADTEQRDQRNHWMPEDRRHIAK